LNNILFKVATDLILCKYYKCDACKNFGIRYIAVVPVGSIHTYKQQSHLDKDYLIFNSKTSYRDMYMYK